MIRVALWLAGLGLCALQIAQTRFIADLSSFLPSAPTAEQRLLVDQLRDGAISRVMLVGIDGSDAAARARVSRALAEALRRDEAFASVANGAATGFERERDLLLAYRYVLSARVGPGRFTAAGLREAIAETIDLLASPAGLLVKALVARDPTGETLAVAEQLRPAEGPALVEGVWSAPDGQRALLIARTRASGSDTDGQQRALEALERAFAKANAAEAGGAARLVATGPGIFSVQARALIRNDVERLAAASLALVAGLLLAVYRSPRALGLGLLPVVSGAVAGIATVSLGFDAVHGITLGFGTTLIGEAVDYSIYLFVQSDRGSAADPGNGIDAFWPTIRLGVLTSLAGFSALLFAGLPGLAQLGVYSIAGLVVAALVTRFVLPVLVPRGLRIRDVSAVGERVLRALPRLARARPAILVLAAAAVAFLALQGRAVWDTDVASLNPIPPAQRALDAQLRAALGASDARHLVAVRAASADAALAAAEQAGARLDALVGRGALGGYESPAHALPSVATQTARLAALPAADALRARLREALRDLPLRPGRLEPFIADVQAARTRGPLAREALAGTALDTALDGLLFRDARGAWTAILGLRPPASGTIDTRAVQEALAGVPRATLLDVKGELDRLYEGYFGRALAMSLAGLAAIAVLLLAVLRDARRAGRVLLPLLAAVAVVAALHLLAGTRLSLLHLVGLLLVVAIGSNYALFFDRMATRRDAAGARTLASLLLANATTVASFGVLGLSTIPVLHALGTTVAAGALLALLFAAAEHGAGAA